MAINLVWRQIFGRCRAEFSEFAGVGGFSVRMGLDLF